MAESSNNNGGEIEYESDPEEAKLSLKARRRVASDDEDEDEKQQLNDKMRSNQRPTRRIDVSDGESEGAVAEYDDALGEDEDYVEERELEEEEYGEDEYGEEYLEEGVVRDDGVAVEERNKVVVESKDGNSHDGGGEERKEAAAVEPFAVPTAGAFYMHDDRFGENAGGGRHRRTIGGRRLWESKDDRKWGHDKFEKLTTQERHHDEHRRGSRGRYRGRGRARGAERFYPQGTKGREFANNIAQNNKKQNDAPKSIRGRGPRRYQPAFKNKDEVPSTQNKQYGESVDKPSRASSVSSSKPMSNPEPSTGPPRKQVASNLNIASPPFYPTGSSTKDNTGLQQRDVQIGAMNQRGQPSTMAESYNMVQSTSSMRGKNVVNSIGMEKLYINDHINDSNSAMTGEPSNMQASVSSSSFSNSGRPQLKGQGRGITSLSHMAYQPVTTTNLANKVPPASQLQYFQRNHGQNHAQSPLQGSGQQFVQRMPGASQTPSPPKAAGAIESGVESASVSSESKTSLTTKGRGSNAQGNGKGPFLYGASQVMGGPANITGGHSDQNFPTFLPIMQFGGQHPGGIGVPAVGMAFPGYVGQPQHGRGNSEMTWLPVLAGAAGALGSPYCPPYITVDGSYNAHPSGQASSAMSNSSDDNKVAKVGGDLTPAQRPDLGNEDSGQRQKNSRRYTEMKFNQ